MPRHIVAIAPLLLATSQLGAQAIAALPVVEIRTSAQSTVELPSSGASLVVNFSASRRTPGEAGRANAERATAIRRALMGLGIPSDSITTRGYTSMLRTDAYGRDTSFVTSNSVVVRTSQLGLIPRMIDTVLAEGATNVSNLQFFARGTEPARLTAITEATRRARQQAETLARAAGGRVGRLLELSTDPPRDREAYPFTEITVVAAEAQTPIQAPSVTVAATVYTRWEFIAASP